MSPGTTARCIDGAGVTAGTSQQVWPDHPEKVLGTTAAYADAQPDSCRAVMMAVLDACRWIDASDANRRTMAQTLAQPAFLDAPVDTILPRVLGDYDDRRWPTPA